MQSYKEKIATGVRGDKVKGEEPKVKENKTLMGGGGVLGANDTQQKQSLLQNKRPLSG